MQFLFQQLLAGQALRIRNVVRPGKICEGTLTLPPPPSLGVKFNCLANCQGNKTMQIPLNFITNCCKLKRVLSLFFSIVLPVEKFDLLAGKPPPIKTICRNKQLARTKKKKKIQQARRKFLCAANIFGWLWVAHAVVLQQLTLIVWPALLHSLGAHTTIC